MSETILLNADMCMKCKTVLVSKHRHDFVTCKCGKLSIDGGLDYKKVCGDWLDGLPLSIIKDEDTGEMYNYKEQNIHMVPESERYKLETKDGKK